MLPAVINADKVIVQSEKMRQFYIENLVQQYGESTRQLWNDKIFGTGSPKFEKVIKTEKKRCCNS
ncbi:MAG: hypothetical protein ACK5LY_00775 [Lachnospirales bacterium]